MTHRLIQAALLVLLAATAIGVVRTREPIAQAITMSFYGLLLAAVLFFYQAPDVALAQLAVGAVALPLMIMLTLARVRRDRERAPRASADGAGGGDR